MASNIVTFFPVLCFVGSVTEKNTVPVMVRMPAVMHANLKLLSNYMDVELPVLVRRAVAAVIECYEETGDLPARFKLVGMSVEKPVLLVAEEQSKYQHRTVKGSHAPEKPPDKSQRDRGDGPRRKVS